MARDFASVKKVDEIRSRWQDRVQARIWLWQSQLGDSRKDRYRQAKEFEREIISAMQWIVCSCSDDELGAERGRKDLDSRLKRAYAQWVKMFSGRFNIRLHREDEQRIQNHLNSRATAPAGPIVPIGQVIKEITQNAAGDVITELLDRCFPGKKPTYLEFAKVFAEQGGITDSKEIQAVARNLKKEGFARNRFADSGR